MSDMLTEGGLVAFFEENVLPKIYQAIEERANADRESIKNLFGDLEKRFDSFESRLDTLEQSYYTIDRRLRVLNSRVSTIEENVDTYTGSGRLREPVPVHIARPDLNSVSDYSYRIFPDYGPRPIRTAKMKAE